MQDRNQFTATVEEPAAVNGEALAHATAPAPNQNLQDLLPWLVPLTTVEQFKTLETAAREDGHGICAPTHLVVKRGEVVGYVSVCAVPMINVWLHTKKVKGRESAYVLNMAENLAAAAGHNMVCVPCGPGSPFAPFINQVGYKNVGLSTINLKNLKR